MVACDLPTLHIALESIVGYGCQEEKTLYSLGHDHDMFPLWAELSWFQVGESPSHATRDTFQRLIVAIEHLHSDGQLFEEALSRLQEVRDDATHCWKDLNEGWNGPERARVVPAIEELEPELRTDDLWRDNTVLNRPAWKEFARNLAPFCDALGHPLSALVEAGSRVAQVKRMSFGSFAARGSEVRRVTQLEYALIKLRASYPGLHFRKTE